MSVRLANLGNRRQRLMMTCLAGALSGAALWSWAFAADDVSASRRAANQKRLDELTSSERQRLEDNARVFRALSPADQTRLRDLQNAIETDPALQSAFQDYESWARQLSPWQRQELRRRTDRESRLEFVDSLLTLPDSSFPSDLEPLGPPEQMLLVRRFVGQIGLFDRAPGTARDAALLIEVLAKQLPQDRREELQRVDQFTRKVRVLRDTLQRTKGQSPSQRLTGKNEKLARDLLEALDDGSPAQQFAEQIGNRRPQNDPRMALLAILTRGLINDLMVTVADRFPTEPTLRQFEQRLSPADRKFLESLPAQERRVQLEKQYLESQVPGLREFREMSLELIAIQADFWRNRPGSQPFEKGRTPFEDNNRRPLERPDLPRRTDERLNEKRPGAPAFNGPPPEK